MSCPPGRTGPSPGWRCGCSRCDVLAHCFTLRDAGLLRLGEAVSLSLPSASPRSPRLVCSLCTRALLPCPLLSGLRGSWKVSDFLLRCLRLQGTCWSGERREFQAPWALSSPLAQVPPRVWPRGLPPAARPEAPALSAAYADELGAVGGAGLEDEARALRLEDDSEQPPMILRTD